MDPAAGIGKRLRSSVLNRRMVQATALALMLLVLARGGEPQPARLTAQTPTFERTGAVMSLLETRCLRCHEGRRSRGGLDLSSRDRLLAGGDSGAALVPGASARSLLLRLVKHEQEPAMPKQGKRLDDAQVALLSAWIDAGAPYARRLGNSDEAAWWSLQPVANPRPPAVDPKHAAWVRNSIDAFVLARFMDAGLTPSPPAEPRVLIRRLYFDLHGLPPAPEEVEAFNREYETSAKPQAAVERLVDRLLASPRYGERWARHWMDVIHFAETHGHDQDVPREHAWPYRDYLIAAFNEDKPYAQFIEEQIAGDVLFPDDPRATVALGFLAAGPWDESSLKDIREDSIDRKAAQYLDRDDMLGTVCLSFLSTTIQCARCHEHKFDPISQKEYFNLQAVFAGVDRANRAFDADRQVRAKRSALLELQADLAAGANVHAKLVVDPVHVATEAAWEREQTKRAAAWSLLAPVAYTSAAGQDITKLDDGSLLFGGKKPERDIYVIETAPTLKTVRAVRLDVLTDDALPQKGPGRQDNGNLHLNELKIEVVAARAGGTLASSATKIVGRSTRRSTASRRRRGAFFPPWGSRIPPCSFSRSRRLSGREIG
jgi:cytochrome c553